MSIDHKFRLELEMPANAKANETETHVEVAIYKNDRKQVVCSIYPVCIRQDGIMNMRLGGPSGYYAVEAMPRLNKKRLDALLTQAKDEVAKKSGRTWDE